ncbi:MAG: hypothetical protein MZV49_03565 [Rhodopseudomonas palustris]|nr:hypothetical protein [Rhodopseudomonas palustris]
MGADPDRRQASKRPRYAGRPASAATATGLMSKHLAQLKALLDEALHWQRPQLAFRPEPTALTQ